MPYWKYAGHVNNSPSVPLYAFGEQFDFTLTFVNDTTEDFNKSYLFVKPEFLEMILAKRSSEGPSSYRQVMQVLDANAFLGVLPVGETDIDFRLINNKTKGVKNIYIQVFVAHEDGATTPRPGYYRDYIPFWKTCYGDVQFWLHEYYPVIPDENCASQSANKSEGFSDSYEPGLFEDSFTPGLWK